MLSKNYFGISVHKSSTSEKESSPTKLPSSGRYEDRSSDLEFSGSESLSPGTFPGLYGEAPTILLPRLARFDSVSVESIVALAERSTGPNSVEQDEIAIPKNCSTIVHAINLLYFTVKKSPDSHLQILLCTNGAPEFR